MEVLYPSSYLGTPPAFPDPPSYPVDTHPAIAQGNHRERTGRTPLTSSTTTAETGTPEQSGNPDPLVEAPSLTGIPSPGAPFGRNSPVEPNAPTVGLGIDVDVVEAEPPPAYSRFDDSRLRQPVASDASDVLGPYPPMSVLNTPAR